MDATGRDRLGRVNPSAWKAWARARCASASLEQGMADVALELGDGRRTHGGHGARARRRIRRAAERASA